MSAIAFERINNEPRSVSFLVAHHQPHGGFECALVLTNRRDPHTVATLRSLPIDGVDALSAEFVCPSKDIAATKSATITAELNGPTEHLTDRSQPHQVSHFRGCTRSEDERFLSS